MSCEELQQEELEVLRSIYEGDERFKVVNDQTFQYKIGEEDHKSFLLEIGWRGRYPNEPPVINMDTFYNKHILQEVKDSIIKHMLKETDEFLGSAMTYSLIENAKENADVLMEAQPEHCPIGEVVTCLENTRIDAQPITSVPKEKKVTMSKAQKRKLYDRLDAKGERPRGWDWVDIVKHLSQTGGNSNSSSACPETQNAHPTSNAPVT